MLIKYNPKVEHLKMVALTPKEGLKLGRTMVRLLPGTNEVTKDEWKAMRGNIATEIASGEISILAQKVSAGRGKVGGVIAKDLKQMPVNLAVKYVSECNNPDTLTKWYKEITNEEVRLAITKKFKKLEIEIPEDEIPDTPNEAPMSLEEFEQDEDSLLNDEEDEDEEEEENNSDDDEDDSEEDDESEADEADDESEGDEDFENMKVAELKVVCEERGIDYKAFTKKSDYIEALTANKE